MTKASAQFFGRNHRKCIQLGKTFEFYQQKHFTLVLNHEVDNEVYNQQVLSILINFSRKFC